MEMKLVEDDDVETIIALYCSPGNNEPVELFVELVNVESVQNVTLLNQQYGVHDPYTKVLRASIDKRSYVHDFNLHLNVGLIYPLVICTNADGEEGPNNDGGSDHQGENFSDPDLDEVSNDIDDEGVREDDNVYAPSLGNPTRGLGLEAGGGCL
ncbi:hypothetical protein GOBAR_DD26452 [Gossypium barbadense]|nr:hypothetical protein GOBAR_DD26452 [Gossypium barbadense]